MLLGAKYIFMYYVHHICIIWNNTNILVTKILENLSDKWTKWNIFFYRSSLSNNMNSFMLPNAVINVYVYLFFWHCFKLTAWPFVVNQAVVYCKQKFKEFMCSNCPLYALLHCLSAQNHWDFYKTILCITRYGCR